MDMCADEVYQMLLLNGTGYHELVRRVDIDYGNQPLFHVSSI